LGAAREPGEIGRLGPYRLLQVLGTGGMGIVFHAEDLQLKRPVALKVMKPEFRTNDEARQRFLREARAVAGLDHEHIVTVYQVGEDCGLPYLAMQLLRGETLEDRLERDKRLPIGEVIRIGREIAAGLAAAHERGLIHRDIKPPNIWLEGEHGRVKILDFGLARATDDLHLTRTGTVMGTPEYMSPEQASGKPVDARADLFSLGCVLYDMCAGQSPFQAKKTMMVLLALATKAPRPLTDLNPEVPAPLAELIMRLLEKQPDDRPASSKVVVDGLRRIETGSGPLLHFGRRRTAGLSAWGRYLMIALVLGAIGACSFLFGGELLRAVKGALGKDRAQPVKPR
jgi:serine/threonine protein kinase